MRFQHFNNRVSAFVYYYIIFLISGLYNQTETAVLRSFKEKDIVQLISERYTTTCLIHSTMALCRLSSPMVGESGQYFLP